MIMEEDLIAILDFGSQYTHLIARRIREFEVRSDIFPWNVSTKELISIKPKGMILSGSPASVYEKDAPLCDRKIFDLGIPILGICYGMQITAYTLGGSVNQGEKREYGKTELIIVDKSDLFQGLNDKTIVWMSHGDYVNHLPEGFDVIANSENCPIAAMRNKSKKLFGLQFHPEVVHTEKGVDILKNFVFNVCKCKPAWKMESFIEKTISEIKDKVGNKKVLCALSGGVDSSTVATLIYRAIGENLTCIFVDHGLLRKNEAQQIIKTFRDNYKMKLIYVNASRRFLNRLKGVIDPEEKRRILGEEFIKVFTEEGKKLGDFQWLAQGTLYPDVIESAKAGSPASRIKTHHNVAGLPGWMTFKLLEPLRMLYKDEVRKVAHLLELPEDIVKRHPFPGPGLSVRIMGEVTEEKIKICRKASHIVEDELKKENLYDKIWQAFAMVGDDKAVGVLGDKKRFGHIVTIRIVESSDGMTADWVKLPYEILEKISNRITNEVPNVTWVSYTISSKPPSTIEPC
ncbi:MAG: glutamine-hydrolyzing GMP synthase [archaeon]|nr:glutamine-hydrolyzing GMP synthase [archaeon]